MRETEPGSEMVVSVQAGDGRRMLVLLSGKQGWPALRSDRHADGAALVLDTAGAWAVVVECKLTVNPDSRNKALDQMRWSYLRLRALAAIVGLEVVGVRLATAFANDAMGDHADPALLKHTLGDELEDDGVRSWRTGQVALTGFAGQFRHDRVQVILEASGRRGSWSVA